MSLNDGNKILQAYCSASTLNFTKYFFLRKTKKKFIVNSHHEVICDTLDKVIDGKITRLIINIAPRYSKTELAVKNFIANGLALNPSAKFIHLSYSDDLANDNSEEVRNIVKSEAYQQLFPYVQVSKTTDSKKKWNTTAGGGVYAVSTGGQVTGFGAGEVDYAEDKSKVNKLLAELEDAVSDLDNLETTNFAGAIIIDDPIKPEDALSDTVRERVNQRFETTIRNRVNSRKTPIIIIMQRLHERDLCGYLLEQEPDEWHVLSLPCVYEDESGQEKALWEHKHTLEELYRIRENNTFVFDTQYMQNPKPIEGLMYREFRTYDAIPYSKVRVRKSYIDTADEGSDYLCCICYEEHPTAVYVTDVLYTKKPMEYTEPKTAEILDRNDIDEVWIESNNGGRGFARNVEKHLRERGNTHIAIEWFHQSENKKSRIFTKSADVTNMIYMPTGWQYMFPQFYKDVIAYRKEGKNAHDDAPDALTGVIDKLGERISGGLLLQDMFG